MKEAERLQRCYLQAQRVLDRQLSMVTIQGELSEANQQRMERLDCIWSRLLIQYHVFLGAKNNAN